MGRDVHVVETPDGWVVKVANEVDGAGVYASREEAIEAGRSAARTEEGDLLVLDETGEVRSRERYGVQGEEVVEDPAMGP